VAIDDLVVPILVLAGLAALTAGWLCLGGRTRTLPMTSPAGGD
jgi:hypothetical protein